MGISRVLNQFQALISILTPVGMVALLFIASLVLFAITRTPKLRFITTMLMIVVFAVAASRGDAESANLPYQVTVLASALKWFLVIPLLFAGGLALIKTPGLKGSATFMLLATAFILFISMLVGKWSADTMARCGVLIAFLVGLTALGANLARQIEPRQIMNVWLKVSIVLGVISLLWIFVSPGTVFLGNRFRSFMSNPNYFGWLCATMFTPVAWRISTTKKRPVPLLIIGLWWLTAMTMTGSRASLLTIIPVCLYVILAMLRKPMHWIMAGGGGVLILFLAQYFIVEWDVTERFMSTQGSGRFETWTVVWPEILHKPYFGHGFGWAENNLDFGLFSSYILLLIDIGFIGTMVLLMAFLILIGRAVKTSRKPAEEMNDLHIRRLVGLYLIGLLLNAIFESWMIGIGGAQLVTFLIFLGITQGMLFRISQATENEYARAEKRRIPDSALSYMAKSAK